VFVEHAVPFVQRDRSFADISDLEPGSGREDLALRPWEHRATPMEAAPAFGEDVRPVRAVRRGVGLPEPVLDQVVRGEPGAARGRWSGVPAIRRSGGTG
jgi:hypothetical protein